jgi:acyl-CoA thioesterase-1
MRTGIFTIAVAALLAGCSEAEEASPAAAPTSQDSAALTAAVEPAPVTGPERHILAFGNSLFAGYRLGEGESYPDKLEDALRARGINARVSNAGVSGDTTAAGRQRIEFVVDGLGERPDLAIVELGGNDLLRGIPPTQTRENLAAILAELRERRIPVLLMGMRAPPNLGADYLAEFDAIYPVLAEEYDAALVPFFLEAVWDRPQLIQPDRIHPTAAGIDALVAATLDEVVGALPETD